MRRLSTHNKNQRIKHIFEYFHKEKRKFVRNRQMADYPLIRRLLIFDKRMIIGRLIGDTEQLVHLYF